MPDTIEWSRRRANTWERFQTSWLENIRHESRINRINWIKHEVKHEVKQEAKHEAKHEAKL